jgi:hypothetical protein
MENLSLPLQKFNDKIRVMNQTNSKILTLNADEARNLHHEIFNLIARISDLTSTPQQAPTTVRMDGGSFK